MKADVSQISSCFSEGSRRRLWREQTLSIPGAVHPGREAGSLKSPSTEAPAPLTLLAGGHPLLAQAWKVSTSAERMSLAQPVPYSFSSFSGAFFWLRMDWGEGTDFSLTVITKNRP